jgi:hypothetical protein
MESYAEIVERVAAARDARVDFSEESIGNPLGVPLVHVRMLLAGADGASPAVVDACFNPHHIQMMYRFPDEDE